MVHQLIITFLFLFTFSFSFAQTEAGLRTYISFDDCTADESSGDPSVISVVNGQPTCENGLCDKSFQFNGIEHFFIAGPFNSIFRTEDFSISLFFKPSHTEGISTIISKSLDCSAFRYFAIRYDADNHQLKVDMVENSIQNASIEDFPLPTTSDGWIHITVVRKDVSTILYVDGQMATQVDAFSRINVNNDDIFTVGKSFCADTDRFFEGELDELRIYDRALEEQEVLDIFNACEAVSTEDFSLSGNELTVFPNPTAQSFQIKSSVSQLIDIQLFNSTGQIVLEQNLSLIHI